MKLLYQTEDINRILTYHYDVHAWRWDVKFWLVGNKWCSDLDGKNVVGELTDNQIKVIKKYMPIIEQHEKENCNWISFQKCRKKTCICKSCNKFCNCNNCNGKIVSCDKTDK